MTQLLKVREVAQQLRVDESSVRRWIDDGALAAVMLPRKANSTRRGFRIPEDAVLAILNTPMTGGRE